MESWNDIRRWRKEQRARICEKRAAVPAAQRAQWTGTIVERLRQLNPAAAGTCVAFYWPLRGEPDLRPFVRELLALGVDAALPVVAREKAPLEFRLWRADSRMMRQSVWNIPIPAEPIVVRPQVLLIPLIGFDGACHRLGNGGGYYDRTLASLSPKPLSIGVGYDVGRLDTIFPQPHDVPMDAIVTDERAVRRLQAP